MPNNEEEKPLVQHVDDGFCVLCEKKMTLKTQRCITDCVHEFCLSCLCRDLSERKNHCPICYSTIKMIHQLDFKSQKTQQEAPPASIKFCNATYILHVSIWSVEDPAKVLADLFQLQHARLIHQGKLLKKGDVWPGTVVQLFGTRKGASSGGNGRHSVRNWPQYRDTIWLKRLKQIVCCPFSVIYEFFRSLIPGTSQEYASLPQRGYTTVVNPSSQAPSQPFQAPGPVSSPHYTDSI